MPRHPHPLTWPDETPDGRLARRRRLLQIDDLLSAIEARNRERGGDDMASLWHLMWYVMLGGTQPGRNLVTGAALLDAALDLQTPLLLVANELDPVEMVALVTPAASLRATLGAPPALLLNSPGLRAVS